MPTKEDTRKRELSTLEPGALIAFAWKLPCKVLSNEKGILTIEHIAAYVTPYRAICIICNDFIELAKKYGICEIKVRLNQVLISITAQNSQEPEELFKHWKEDWDKTEY